eukprot:GHVR01142297.1.p1 GENE.GHVR01142297.1~~GHVR01142297.1.p1  ORF type:complete len:478 (-),score=67.60 GHVR01142297.1:218-1651(-)
MLLYYCVTLLLLLTVISYNQPIPYFSVKSPEVLQRNVNKTGERIHEDAYEECLPSLVKFFPRDCIINQFTRDFLGVLITVCHETRVGRRYIDFNNNYSDNDVLCDVDNITTLSNKLLLLMHEQIKNIPAITPMCTSGSTNSIQSNPTSMTTYNELKLSIQQNTKKCLKYFNSEAYQVYTTYSTHLDNLCHHVKSIDWGMIIENNVNYLTRTADDITFSLVETKERHVELLENTLHAIELHGRLEDQIHGTSEKISTLSIQFDKYSNYVTQSLDTMSAVWIKFEYWQTRLIGQVLELKTIGVYIIMMVIVIFITSFRCTSHIRSHLILLLLIALMGECGLIRFFSSVGKDPKDTLFWLDWYEYISCIIGILLLVCMSLGYKDPIKDIMRITPMMTGMASRLDSYINTLADKHQERYTHTHTHTDIDISNNSVLCVEEARNVVSCLLHVCGNVNAFSANGRLSDCMSTLLEGAASHESK